MTAEDFIKTLKPQDFSIDNFIDTIKKAYNTGYSNGSTYAFKKCGTL